MITLGLLGFLLWCLLLSGVVYLAWEWIRDFLKWPITRTARYTGLLIRLLVTAVAIAIVIGVPLDLANL